MVAVAENYRRLIEEVRAVATNCGRDPETVTVVAVTKTWPLEHVLPAYDAGCRDFGENKVQEVVAKVDDAPRDLTWHLIGTLQRNKVKDVIGKVGLIHSVDSVRLAEAIAKRGVGADITTDILLQVNTSGEASKHGFTPEECLGAIEQVLALPGVNVKGLMTMAPFTEDVAAVRHCFSSLRELRDTLQSQVGAAAHLEHLSMGMSHDYRIAIEEGATLVRVGSAIFGSRN